MWHVSSITKCGMFPPSQPPPRPPPLMPPQQGKGLARHDRLPPSLACHSPASHHRQGNGSVQHSIWNARRGAAFHMCSIPYGMLAVCSILYRGSSPPRSGQGGTSPDTHLDVGGRHHRQGALGPFHRSEQPPPRSLGHLHRPRQPHKHIHTSEYTTIHEIQSCGRSSRSEHGGNGASVPQYRACLS